MVKKSKIKQRIDYELATKGKATFQERCVHCGARCLRPGQASILHTVGEIPSGAIDGQNKSFTLAHKPVESSLQIQAQLGDELFDIRGALSGKVLTFDRPPPVTAKIILDYLYVEEY